MKRESEECRKKECRIMTLNGHNAGDIRLRDLYEKPEKLEKRSIRKKEKRIVRGTNCMRYLS